MKLHNFKRCVTGYEYEEATGYAWYDTQLDILCMLYRSPETKQWLLIDELTGLWLAVSGETRQKTLEAWQSFKDIRNLSKKEVYELRDSFMERRKKAQTLA